MLHKDRKIRSIFIGGGTPTILPTTQIKKLIDQVKANSDIGRNIEITIEANPETVDKQKLLELKNTGINRFSFGIQTFDDKTLKYLNRAHSSEKAISAIKAAQDIGLTNINIDLMFGLPGQTLEQMINDIDKAVVLKPTHISHYQLTLEPETKLAELKPNMPSEELLTEMYSRSRPYLTQLGYSNYETSAFAKPDFECQHNLNYWKFGDYIGIGAGAHGKQTTKDGIIRYHKPSDYREYIEAVNNGDARTAEVLNSSDIILEFMINAMRLNNGWDKQLFQKRTGLDYSAIESRINELATSGLIEIQEDIIGPTAQGRMLLDEILGEFV